jgi:hypothetical protein
MFGWVWLSGFLVTFAALFGLCVYVGKGEAAEGKDISEVMKDFFEYVFACWVFSLLSWLAFALTIAMIIILKARKNAEV